MTKAKLPPAIDAGVTLLAGASAGFVLYAMPEGVLAKGFAALRLASFSPRFQPPFEPALRFSLAALACVVTMAFVWSLMKALDKPGRTKPIAAPEIDAEPEAPRLRKADSHPDAPARRPLLAGRDLGEPLDLDPAQALAPEAEEEFLLQPEALAEPERQPEPIADWIPHSEPVAVHPEPETRPPFLVAQEPEEELDEPEEQRAEEPSEDSIVSLMHRFETGLGRKKQALTETRREAPAAAPTHLPPQPQAAPEPVSGPAPVGHRLRSAIAGLQKASGQ